MYIYKYISIPPPPTIKTLAPNRRPPSSPSPPPLAIPAAQGGGVNVDAVRLTSVLFLTDLPPFPSWISFPHSQIRVYFILFDLCVFRRRMTANDGGGDCRLVLGHFQAWVSFVPRFLLFSSLQKSEPSPFSIVLRVPLLFPRFQ